MMRLFGERLSQRINQPVLVEPKPGAASVLGASAALQAPAGGYTLLFTGPSGYVPEFNKNLPFDFLREFTAVAIVAQNPLGVTINREFGARSVKELIDRAKTNPGKTSSAAQQQIVELYRRWADAVKAVGYKPE